MASAGPGWELDIQTASGGLTIFDGTLTQTGCEVSITNTSDGSVTVAGSLAEDGTWTATISGSSTGNLTATFVNGFPYVMLNSFSGTIDGEVITGGLGNFMGGATSCLLASPGAGWELDIQTAIGGLTIFDGTLTQFGCTVSITNTADGSVTVAGSLAESGVWTATISGSSSGNLTATFTGGPPYTGLTNLSGTLDGEAITGGSGTFLGGGSSCGMASPGAGWELDIQTAIGGLTIFDGTLTQFGCTVSITNTADGSVTVAGSLAESGVWTATISGSSSGNLTATFTGGPPYTGLTNLSGTLDGEAITGGSGTWD